MTLLPSLWRQICACNLKKNWLKIKLKGLDPVVELKSPEDGFEAAQNNFKLVKEKCDKAKNQFNKKYKNYWCIASKTI